MLTPPEEIFIITNMLADAECRRLSDDDLFRRHSNTSEGSDSRNTLSSEVKRREFMAGQAAGRTANRLAILTACLIAVGLIQAAATYSTNTRHLDQSPSLCNRYSMSTSNGRISILDSQTGLVFVQETDGWREYQPQSGREIIRRCFPAIGNDLRRNRE